MERKNSILAITLSLILISGAISPAFVPPAFASTVLYGIDGGGGNVNPELYTINTATGAAASVGVIGAGVLGCGAMDFHPVSGVLWAICNDDSDDHLVLITINTSTGAGNHEDDITGDLTDAGFLRVFGMSFRNADNVLYVSAADTNSEGGFDAVDLHTLDITDGSSVKKGNMVDSSNGNGIAFSAGDTLHHSDDTDLNTLNQNTGAATQDEPHTFDAPLAGPSRNNAMDYEPGTGVLFASTNDSAGGGAGPGPNYLSIVDTGNGDVTPVGAGSQTVTGLDAIAFQEVDEIFEDCFVHVEWDNPLSFTDPTQPTAPIEFDDECPGGSLGTVPPNPTLECGFSAGNNNNEGSEQCRIKIPNFIDNLDTKIIFIDITFTGDPTPSIPPTVTCFDPTLPGGSAPGNLIDEGLDGSGLFIWDFECIPNPDWEQIDILLDSNVQKIQIWTTSFDDPAVGGTFIPIDQSALLLAGVQSISMWMIPVVIAGIGIGIFVIKRRK